MLVLDFAIRRCEEGESQNLLCVFIPSSQVSSEVVCRKAPGLQRNAQALEFQIMQWREFTWNLLQNRLTLSFLTGHYMQSVVLQIRPDFKLVVMLINVARTALCLPYSTWRPQELPFSWITRWKGARIPVAPALLLLYLLCFLVISVHLGWNVVTFQVRRRYHKMERSLVSGHQNSWCVMVFVWLFIFQRDNINGVALHAVKRRLRTAGSLVALVKRYSRPEKKKLVIWYTFPPTSFSFSVPVVSGSIFREETLEVEVFLLDWNTRECEGVY